MKTPGMQGDEDSENARIPFEKMSDRNVINWTAAGSGRTSKNRPAFQKK